MSQSFSRCKRCKNGNTLTWPDYALEAKECAAGFIRDYTHWMQERINGAKHEQLALRNRFYHWIVKYAHSTFDIAEAAKELCEDHTIWFDEQECVFAGCYMEGSALMVELENLNPSRKDWCIELVLHKENDKWKVSSYWVGDQELNTFICPEL